jgi:lipoprotein-anchoring transpeptidase ErfK/SrfK
MIAGAAVAVAALTGGVIAFVATRGPSAAQKQAHAQAVAQAHAAAVAAAVRDTQTQLLAALRVSPATGATSVPLDSPVTVTDTAGTLAAVKVVSAAGAVVPGAVSATTGAWRSAGALAPGTTYTVSATVTAGRVSASHSSTFTTLTPVATVTANVFPSEGMTVGVGQPLVLYFNHDVASTAVQKAIESRLTIAMSTPVAGGWYWFSDHELHFRPQAYWPANETVRVTGDLNGIDVGGGEWTGGSILDTFAIGNSRVSYANLQSEEMTVTENGRTLYTFPISGGRPQYPTMNGTHIVMDRESVVHMVSSTVGIPVHSPNGYDEYVYDDVHISDSGEYVHAAPWSVSSQGVTNVSHGCINLSTAHALTFYNLSRVGDVVVVTGSPRPAVWGDHGVMDWSGPTWSQWTAARVVSIHPAAPATTTPSTAAPTTAATGAAATSGVTSATTRPTPATTAPAGATATATTKP